MQNKRLAIFVLLLGFGLAAAVGLPVRVLLDETGLAEVHIQGRHSLWSLAGRLATVEGGRTYRLLADSRGIELTCDSPPCPVQGYVGRLISFVPAEGLVRVGDRDYRGYLRVVWRDGRLLLINKVNIEDYLRGVLPGEVPLSFPYEVLKAQAILARTYTLSRLGSNPDYDLCDTSRCQVYLGADAEAERYDRAVRETAGRVLAYGGRPISAVYHADSGGKTAAAVEVWGSNIPYLQSRDDPWSLDQRWRVTVSPAKVRQVLAEMGHSVASVSSLKVVERGASGRITAMYVGTGSGGLRLGVPEVGRFLRSLGLPSTLASLSGWTFSGRGSGHGVGMSQWGARGFAARGWNYREILAYYYPKTVLTHYQLSASH
ncbi:SpoIID/LytB domain-containing protein [Oceanithermus sp.]